LFSAFIAASFRRFIPKELQGRLNWAKRNYEFHRSKAEELKRELKQQKVSNVLGGLYPKYLPKQMK